MEEFKIPDVLPKTTATKSSEFEEKSVETNSDSMKKLSAQKAIPTIPKAECPYLEPMWSDKPVNQEIEYKFEILKSGAIIEQINNLQTKPYWIIGRLDQNYIPMAHPTVSRFHAVIQYRPNIENTVSDDSKKEEKVKSKIESGWYIYDLGSTHGTFLNKVRIPIKTYIRIHVGHMLKFGASLRSFILQGPEYDEEPESELTVTELKERRKQEEELKKKEQQMQEEQREKEGISWGMTEDADEETDLSINPYATTNNEELFLDDPKKTLRGFFEREGLNLDYKCDEMSPGTFVCRIELPIDDNMGKQITAEICHKGKKKDCVVQCALEACRILDRYGVLRQSHHEPLKRKAPKADSDDEDDFLDRTGDIERKKLKKANAGQNVTLTYEDLIKQEEEMISKLTEVENEIAIYQENLKKIKESKSDLEDDLDNYMENLAKKSVNIDKTEIRKLRVNEQQLKAEIQKVKKLIKIAKPFDLPPISGTSKMLTDKKAPTLPMFGKRNKFKFTIERTSTSKSETSTSKELKSDEEEFEEDDEINEVKESKKRKEEEEYDKSKEEPTQSETDKPIEMQIENNKEKDIQVKLYGPAIIPKEILKQNTEDETSSTLMQSTDKEDNSLLEKSSEVKKSANEKVKDDCITKFANEDILNKVEPVTEWISKSPDSQEPEQMESDETLTDDTVKESNKEKKLENSEMDDISEINKKRKHRTRNRHRRENVDIDDYNEYIDNERQSDWVPPKNQSGDGRTLLNEKFGY